MKLVICEKPSQGRDIAKILGASSRKDNYLEGNGYQVTWCVGHLLETAPPDFYNENLKPWNISKLPVIPTNWKMLETSKTKTQYRTIKKLLKSTKHVIIATDADREGEVIAREILERENYKGHIERLWLSALDDKSIRKALTEIKPGEETESLYYAGLGRQRADWLAGMNLTMGASSLFGNPSSGVLSIGRVQTPTLKLVVDRDLEIENFVPKDYFVVKALFETADKKVWTTWQVPEYAQGDDAGRCLDKKFAQAVVSNINNKPGKVKEYTERKKKQSAPLPFSLSALQKKASSMYGMSAKQVLQTAQSLYETHKATTYPRTDCGYLPVSQFAEAPQVLSALKKIDPSITKIVDKSNTSFKSPTWNDKKITAHHGIIPTTNPSVNIGKMSEAERRLYDLIRRHYIAQFLGDHEYIAVKLTVLCENELFSASGKRPLVQGWKDAFLKDQRDSVIKEDDEQDNLPKFTNGESVKNTDAHVESKKTTPPPYFTEGSLIEAMKNIGKYVTNPKLKAILRETSGIGTEATRSNIIETLFKRKYIVRKGKKVTSTQKGRSLIDTVPDIIKNPETTAQWEQALDEVAEGKRTLGQFMTAQEKGLHMMLKALQNERNNASSTQRNFDSSSSDGKVYNCHECGKPLSKRKSSKTNKFFWGCTGYPECNVILEDKRGKPAKPKKPVEQPKEKFACPKCSSDLILRESKKGSRFWGCSNYPECKTTLPDNKGKPMTDEDSQKDSSGKTHTCPQCKKANLKRIKGKSGYFWGCSNYKDGCQYTCPDKNNKPNPEKLYPCPECDSGMLRKISGKNGDFWGCSNYKDGCTKVCQDDNGKPVLE